jgi:hypothetical protein
VLLNETAETIAIASQAGFRCFNGIAESRSDLQAEIRADGTQV